MDPKRRADIPPVATGEDLVNVNFLTKWCEEKHKGQVKIARWMLTAACGTALVFGTWVTTEIFGGQRMLSTFGVRMEASAKERDALLAHVQDVAARSNTLHELVVKDTARIVTLEKESEKLDVALKELAKGQAEIKETLAELKTIVSGRKTPER